MLYIFASSYYGIATKKMFDFKNALKIYYDSDKTGKFGRNWLLNWSFLKSEWKVNTCVVLIRMNITFANQLFLYVMEFIAVSRNTIEVSKSISL